MHSHIWCLSYRYSFRPPSLSLRHFPVDPADSMLDSSYDERLSHEAQRRSIPCRVDSILLYFHLSFSPCLHGPIIKGIKLVWMPMTVATTPQRYVSGDRSP